MPTNEKPTTCSGDTNPCTDFNCGPCIDYAIATEGDYPESVGCECEQDWRCHLHAVEAAR